MAHSKPAALSSAAASGFLTASERVKQWLLAFVITRFLPAPRDVAAA